MARTISPTSVLTTYRLHDGHAVHAGQAEVEHEHVREERHRQADRAGPVLGLPHDLEVAGELEVQAQEAAERLVVVHHRHAEHPGHGHRARTVTTALRERRDRPSWA